jgi:hypothetical protein
MEDDDYIPCEICENLIYSRNYEAHILECTMLIPISFYQEEESTILHDEDISYLSSHITRNHQISGGNIRSFLNEHFNGVSGTSPPSSNSNRLFLRITPVAANIIMPLQTFDDVEIGLTKKEISENSHVIEKYDPNELCVICQEKLGESKDDKLQLKCEHIFCNRCILAWLNKHKKCPLCKIDLSDQNLITYLKTI